MASECDRRAIIEASLAPTRSRMKEIVAEMEPLNTELNALRDHCRVTIKNFKDKEMTRGITKTFDMNETFKIARFYVITRTKESRNSVIVDDFLYHLQMKGIPEIYVASSRRDEIYFNIIPNTMSDVFVSDLKNIPEELKAILSNQRLRRRYRKNIRIAIILDVDDVDYLIKLNDLHFMFAEHSYMNISIFIVTCHKLPDYIYQHVSYIISMGGLSKSMYYDFYNYSYDYFNYPRFPIFSKMYTNITENGGCMVLDNNVVSQHFMDFLYRYRAKTIDENIYEDAVVKVQSVVRMYIGFKVAQAFKLHNQYKYDNNNFK